MNMPETWILVVIASLALWYLSHQAGRLDRLHHRIEMSKATLDTNLAKRSGIVLEIANSGLFDRVTSAVLAQGAHDALDDDDLTSFSRLETENNLSELLRDAIEAMQPIAQVEQNLEELKLFSDLENVCNRVVLTHRFMGEAVDDCLAIRKLHLVRLLHLAGLAPLPAKIELDVVPPEFPSIR